MLLDALPASASSSRGVQISGPENGGQPIYLVHKLIYVTHEKCFGLTIQCNCSSFGI